MCIINQVNVSAQRYTPRGKEGFLFLFFCLYLICFNQAAHDRFIWSAYVYAATRACVRVITTRYRPRGYNTRLEKTSPATLRFPHYGTISQFTNTKQTYLQSAHTEQPDTRSSAVCVREEKEARP